MYEDKCFVKVVKQNQALSKQFDHMLIKKPLVHTFIRIFKTI